MTILDVEMVEASEKAEITTVVTIEEAMPSKDIDPRVTGADSQTSSVEELESFRPDLEDLIRRLQIGKNLRSESKEALKRFLSNNLDVFAWKREDMVRIDLKKVVTISKSIPNF
ncbi:Uncharacterized protein Adt_33745 [Abeliophyllum distichum]|uniref:Uncharacterized protein n=1 Tax=Abeliophyllum distichum TaxID=126358 RepID=A0ABD1QY24_9LAMI